MFSYAKKSVAPSYAIPRKVTVHSTCPNKDRMGVFQLIPNVTVSLDDVREAYELRKGGMTGDNYAVFCLDGENVERYLPVVEQLETSYRLTEFFAAKKEPIHEYRSTIYDALNVAIGAMLGQYGGDDSGAEY